MYYYYFLFFIFLVSVTWYIQVLFLLKFFNDPQNKILGAANDIHVKFFFHIFTHETQHSIESIPLPSRPLPNLIFSIKFKPPHNCCPFSRWCRQNKSWGYRQFGPLDKLFSVVRDTTWLFWFYKIKKNLQFKKN